MSLKDLAKDAKKTKAKEPGKKVSKTNIMKDGGKSKEKKLSLSDRILKADKNVAEAMKKATDHQVTAEQRRLHAFMRKHSTLNAFISNSGPKTTVRKKPEAVINLDASRELPEGVVRYEPKDTDAKKKLDEYYAALKKSKEAAIKWTKKEGNTSPYHLAAKKYNLGFTQSKPTKPKLISLTFPQGGLIDLGAYGHNNLEGVDFEDKTKVHKLLSVDDTNSIVSNLLYGKIKENPAIYEGTDMSASNIVVAIRNKTVEDPETGEKSVEVKVQLKAEDRRSLLTPYNFVPLRRYQTKTLSKLSKEEVIAQSTNYLADYYAEGEKGEPSEAERFTAKAQKLVKEVGDGKYSFELFANPEKAVVYNWYKSTKDKTVDENPQLALKDSDGKLLSKELLAEEYSLADYKAGEVLLEAGVSVKDLAKKLTALKKNSKKPSITSASGEVAASFLMQQSSFNKARVKGFSDIGKASAHLLSL